MKNIIPTFITFLILHWMLDGGVINTYVLDIIMGKLFYEKKKNIFRWKQIGLHANLVGVLLA